MKTSKQKYPDAAVSLARQLCRDAIWDGNRCNWMGVSAADSLSGRTIYARSLEADFYSGTSGIAFFLFSVLKIFPDTLIEKTAKGALQQAMVFYKNKKITSPGFYTGAAGIAFVLQQAADFFGDNKYMANSKQLLKQISKLPDDKIGNDGVNGIAGVLPALIFLYKREESKEIKNLLLRYAELLEARAEKSAGGLSWKTIEGSKKNLTGFGHGAAGIGTACMELYHFLRAEKWQTMARLAFAYENSLYNISEQNWPDFRYDDKGTSFSMAWCHGAPGIVLSRLRAFEISGEINYKRQAAKGIETILRYLSFPYLGNYSLCHGISGNADILLYASSVLKKPKLKDAVYDSARDCIEQYISKKMNPPDGLFTQYGMPGFMEGKAGMGYFFLRLCDQKMFPPALLVNTQV